MTNRLDFSKTTKRIAAEKVSYFCSNPNCKRFTIGPNDSSQPHRYGEAAHIYAAAKGGPRSNCKMTEKELKSEENCLWLCNTCHEMIDANPNKFTPELLKEWKASAEARALEIVTNQEKSQELIARIEGDNDLSTFFDELFYRGDFQKIAIAISKLSKTENNPSIIKEEIAFAQIRFDSFCARDNISDDLKCFSSYSDIIKEKLVDFAIKCFDAELCGKITLFSNDPIKRELASLISSHADLIQINNYISTNIEHITELGLISHLRIVGALFSGKIALDQNQQRISHRDGWLLEIVDTISDFYYDVINKRNIDEKRLQSIIDKRDLFLWLDPYYIDVLISNNFHFFPKGALLESFLDFLINKCASTSKLRTYYFFAVLHRDEIKPKLDQILSLGMKHNDEILIAFTLSMIVQNNPEKALMFIDEHYYLMKNNLMVVDTYRLAKTKMKQPFNLLFFLENEYEGDKNDQYYILHAAGLKEANDFDGFAKDWEKYKSIINYNDVFVTLALQIASDINDELFIMKVSQESMDPATIYFAAEIVCQKYTNRDLVLTTINRMKLFIGTMPNNYNYLMFALLAKIQRLDEALEYGEKAYFQENIKGVAPYILQMRLDLARFEEDELIHDIQNTSKDSQTLVLLGYILIKSGKQRQGWDYIARAVGLQKNSNDNTILSSFIDCRYLDTKDETNEYSFVVLDDGYSFLLLPNNEEQYYGNSVMGIDIYYVNQNQNLLFLKKDDSVEIMGKTHKVEGVFEYYRIFHKKSMEQLALSPYSQSFCSNNTQALLNELYMFIANADEEQDKFLESTNDLSLPFFMFSKMFGKDIFSSACALYYSNKRKSFFVLKKDIDGPSLTMPDKPMFDVESFYLAHRLGITPEVIKDAGCCLTSLTRGAIANELSRQKNDYCDKSEKGSLTIDKEKNIPLYFQRTKETRQKALQEIQKMEELLAAFEVSTPRLDSYTHEESEILNQLKAQGDEVDAELVETLWSGKTVFSNNKALHIAQSIGNGKVYDISTFLSLCSCSALETIDAVKKLQKTNIVQYLTPSVFDSIMKKIELIKDEVNKKKVVDGLVELIKGNWDNNWSPEAIEIHKTVVYLASVGERNKIAINDPIHNELRKVFFELVKDYISLNPNNKT